MQNSQKNLYKKLLGEKGELKVLKFLKSKGYKILEKNYKTSFGEADIIALKDKVYCFIEVKTRTSLKFGTPAQAVGYKKQSKYREIANYYMLKNNLDDVEISFVVAEVLDDEINLILEAF